MTFQFAVEEFKAFAQLHLQFLALRMRRFKGFFALFPAEMTQQVEFPRWALIKWLMLESSRTPAHGRGRLMSWRSAREDASHEMMFQNFPMGEGSKETRLSTVGRVRPLASRRGPGRCLILEPRSSSCCQRSLFTPSSLVLCVVTVASMFCDFDSLYSMTSRRHWC